jgi:molybdenum-dependent DNA-binding transcriptional regulator ModE
LELTQLQGRVGQVQVEIQGVVFQSVLDVEKFIFNDYKEYSKGLFFDAVSLLQIVHGNMGKSGEEIIESEYHAKRSNYSSDLDAKYSASFKSVVLPTKILNGIENQVGSLVSAFENIYPAGSKLAAISNQLLGDSVLFIKNMLTFMTEFYTEMCRTSASGEAGNWGLTCQIINRLFKDLSVQRRSGGEARSIEEPVARGAKYLWLTLQTHRVMQEYTKTKFREHPSIAPMLNISLFKTMVTIEKFDTLREACKKMEVTVQAAKLLADKALSAANAGKGQGKRELKP